MSNPNLSVVIPVFNGARYLGEAIESVYRECTEPLQVIVVNDGSTDRSEQVARQYGGVAVLNQLHCGVAAARNSGMRAATTEFVGFHDADDICLAGRFDRQMQLLRQYPYLDFCLTKIESFIEPNEPVPAELTTAEVLQPRMGFVSTAVMRRRFFEQSMQFDETLSSGEDIEWLIRADRSSARYCVLTDILVRRRIHASNISGNIALHHKALFAILRSAAKSRSS